MKVLFLSISTAVSEINNQGIYPDLIRYIAAQGHDVFVVCPYERRTKLSTKLNRTNNISILGVRTLNITKSNLFEKFFATLLIEYQFKLGINRYFNDVKFDLILYSTPPITFNNLISNLKGKCTASTYLMLKDIFPQNAVDLGLLKENSWLFRFFKAKEEKLYNVSDRIGCMSPANVRYLLDNHPKLDIEKVGICPNAIEIKERLGIDRRRVLEKFNIPTDRVVFIFGGNLGVGQGVDFIIRALDSNSKREDLFFVIVGNGNRYNVLDKWFNNNKPSNAILMDRLDKRYYNELEASCDVGMLFLSDRFTIPNFPSRTLSYLEARLPILVCTDEVCDLGQISEENNFGKFCRFGDLDKFNKVIDFFFENENQRVNMGNLGFNYLVYNYQVFHAYQSIFESFEK